MVRKTSTQQSNKKPWLKRADFPIGTRHTGKIVRCQLVTFLPGKYNSEPEEKLVIEMDNFQFAWKPNNMSVNMLIDRFGENEPEWRGKVITITRPCDWNDAMIEGDGTKDTLPDAVYVSHLTDEYTAPQYDSPADANKEVPPLEKTVDDEWPE